MHTLSQDANRQEPTWARVRELTEQLSETCDMKESTDKNDLIRETCKKINETLDRLNGKIK